MTIRFRSTLWLVLLLRATPIAAAGTPDVLAQIDRLLLLQDAAADGQQAAVEAQKALLPVIASALSEAHDDQAHRLSSGTIAFVLSGGDPQSAERIAAMEGVPAELKMLLDAAALFMRGERAAAAKLLAGVDPRDLPNRLAGRVALAQALITKGEAQQERFSLAMAAMPGTLIEESALRRSALAFGEAGNEAGFWQRLARYGRRFPRSVYGDAFWAEVMTGIATRAAQGKIPSLDRLDMLLAERPVAVRRRLYLVLARCAAAAGVPKLTLFAGRRLERLSEDGSIEARMGALYTALYRIADADGDDARRQLLDLTPEVFEAPEQGLAEAAGALAKQIQRPPAEAASGLPDEPPPKGATETRAEQLLDQTSKLLTEGR